MTTNIVNRFESVDAFIADFARKGITRGDNDGNGHRWDLGVEFAEARELAVKGDPSVVATTTAALDRIEIGMGEHTGWETRRDVWGSRPDVAAYLAGSPFNMKRSVRAPRSTRHVSLYVCIVCSATIPASDMLTRGQTILALLETLQQMQVGVDLYLLGEMGGRDRNIFEIIRVESRPLDLSTAGFAIAHPAFARNLVYTHAGRDNFNGTWPADYTRHDYAEIRAAAVGIEPSDIVIPACHAADPAVRDPSKFVEEKISQIAKG